MTNNGQAKPELAVNQHGATVADALNGFIGHAAEGLAHDVRLDIATAYFNAGGYSLLADSLDKLHSVRLLLGAEPAPPERCTRALRSEPVNARRAEKHRVSGVLADHEQALAVDRDLLGFSREADASARRLVDWLRSGGVQVRRLEDRFLHGKAFVVAAHGHGVVSGSSNFTRAGLSTNLELNLGNYTPHTVSAVAAWFDELWDAAADYDLAELFEPRFEAHPPQLIYLRMLWERYQADLDEEASADEPRSSIKLTSFQREGLVRARRLLKEFNGVLIADEVGLGKTYFAGKLIEEAAIGQRQNVLVICPAALRDGPWKAFERQHNLPMTLISFEQLTAGRYLEQQLTVPHQKYALVVVDEAHNLRNPSTQRASALRELLKGLPPKKLVLLTATPVNNSLMDLYHLLGYFLRNDGIFAAEGIRSLRDHFTEAMQKTAGLSPHHLFDVLDTVAVRRTRSHVKKHYGDAKISVDGVEQQIVFPTPRVRKVTYDMDQVLPGFFDDLAAAINPDANPDADDKALTLARYVPSNYARDRNNPESYELQLAGLLRSGMLKRFESSPHAFALTCERMARGCEAFAALAEDHHRVATGGAIADWAATDSDDIEEIDRYLESHLEDLEDADGYDLERMVGHARRDRDLLAGFAAKARTVTRRSDPTLAALTDELAAIAAQARDEGIGEDDERNKRKVLVFTYFADTVEWIFEFLEDQVQRDDRLAVYRGRIAQYTGSDSSRSPAMEFAPETAGGAGVGGFVDRDRYDILVATDVLAEGLNLQQARHIINYDLPWNPMRLVQRHGRIDRIGSKHREVFLRCVFPDARLDELLRLEERLNHKIAQVAASVGVGEVIPGQQHQLELNFADTRSEIERLRDEDATIFEQGGTAMDAQSGEEFRAELRRAIADDDTAARILKLPWGTGSGMAASGAGASSAAGTLSGSGSGAAKSGYVFCARVGDDPKPLFRFVPTDGANAGSATGNEATGDATGSGATGANAGGAIDSENTGSATGANAGGATNDATDGGATGAKAGGTTGGAIVDGTLECLLRARPPQGFDTPRALDDDTAAGAYDAWQSARADILERWNFHADKANLEPRIPKALRDAAEVLRSSPPAGLDDEQIRSACLALQSPYTDRITRLVRKALQNAVTLAAQAEAVLRVVEEQGLTPQPVAAPLPVITADDIHLVCWQALSS